MTLYGVFCRLEAIPSLSTAPAATMIVDVFFLTAATPHTTQYPPTKHGAFHVPVFGFDFKDSFATIVAYRTLTGNSSEVTPFVYHPLELLLSYYALELLLSYALELLLSYIRAGFPHSTICQRH